MIHRRKGGRFVSQKEGEKHLWERKGNADEKSELYKNNYADFILY